MQHSEFFFHAIRNSFNIKSTDDEEEMIADLKKGCVYYFKSTINIYSKNFNLTTEKVKELCAIGEKSRRNLTTSEAKELGVVHEIIEKLPF